MASRDRPRSCSRPGPGAFLRRTADGAAHGRNRSGARGPGLDRSARRARARLAAVAVRNRDRALVTAVAVPFLVFTTHEVQEDAALGGWLMPVVPPMVSASTGALLLAHTPAGQPRLTLLVGCYAMFGLALMASLVIVASIWQRLTRYKIGPARTVPTLWIVPGPLGQSITAASLLGANAHLAVPDRLGVRGVRGAVRARGMGLRTALGCVGNSDHGPRRGRTPAVLTDMVVVHVFRWARS